MRNKKINTNLRWTLPKSKEKLFLIDLRIGVLILKKYEILKFDLVGLNPINNL